MTKLGMSLFDLAYMQVLKEKRTGKKIKNIMLTTINKAVRIRHYLDNLERTKKSRGIIIKNKKLADRAKDMV
jgi:hypothetical protein